MGRWEFDSLRPDLVVATDTSLCILQLTVGLESNLQIKSDLKKTKYHSFISDLTPTFSNIKFINLSMSTLGLLGKSSDSLLLLLEDLKFDKPSSKYIIKKIMNIAIRCSYYKILSQKQALEQPWIIKSLITAYYRYYLFCFFVYAAICRRISSSICWFYPFVVFNFVFFWYVEMANSQLYTT